MNTDYAIHPFGDSALIVETADEISEAAYGRIRGLAEVVAQNPPEALIELIPAYRSLLVMYDSLLADYASMESAIHSLIPRVEPFKGPASEIARIPVCYESPHCMDLDEVANHAGLKPREVVELHSANTYLVYMLGFTPGFPYLGGMSERIATPRRPSPRTKIPAGSVGIADRQTGIYPMESPGGWNIIGRTPVPLFDHAREPPALLRAGQYIRFYPISPDEFDRIARDVSRGTWTPDIEKASRGEA
jgi:inhibitor of KinA